MSMKIIGQGYSPPVSAKAAAKAAAFSAEAGGADASASSGARAASRPGSELARGSRIGETRPALPADAREAAGARTAAKASTVARSGFVPASARGNPPSGSPEAQRLADVESDAARYSAPAPPVTVSTPVTRALDAATARQQRTVDGFEAQAAAEQVTIDRATQIRDRGQAGIRKVPRSDSSGPGKTAQRLDRGIDAAAGSGSPASGSGQIRAAPANPQQDQIIAEATRRRDEARSSASAEQRTLDVMTSQGNSLRYREQIQADIGGVEGADRSTGIAYQRLVDGAPQAAPQLGEELSAAQRQDLSDTQRYHYDRYVRALGDSTLAASRLDATAAHSIESELQTQVYVNDAAYEPAVRAMRDAFNEALRQEGEEVEVFTPQSIEAALPGAANAELRAQQRQGLTQQLEEASSAAETYDAAWDLNRSVVRDLTSDRVATRDALAEALAAGPDQDQDRATALAEGLAPLNTEIEVKQSYLNSRLGAADLVQAQAQLDASSAALQSFDSANPTGPNPGRAEIARAVQADQDILELTAEAAQAGNASFLAAFGAQRAMQRPGELNEGAARTLRLQANASVSQLNVHVLENMEGGLRTELARAMIAGQSVGANDARRQEDLRSQLSEARAQLMRDDFELDLDPDISDEDFADRQYEFYRDTPTALIGLDDETQEALRQNPREGDRNFLVSGAEFVGGVVMVNVGAAMSATGVGAVAGVPLAALGATMVAHSVTDVANGRTTDPIFSQGLQHFGVGRTTAQRVDFGVTLVASTASAAAGIGRVGAAGAVGPAGAIERAGVAATAGAARSSGAGVVGTMDVVAGPASSGAIRSVLRGARGTSISERQVFGNFTHRSINGRGFALTFGGVGAISSGINTRLAGGDWGQVAQASGVGFGVGTLGSLAPLEVFRRSATVLKPSFIGGFGLNPMTGGRVRPTVLTNLAASTLAGGASSQLVNTLVLDNAWNWEGFYRGLAVGASGAYTGLAVASNLRWGGGTLTTPRAILRADQEIPAGANRPSYPLSILINLSPGQGARIAAAGVASRVYGSQISAARPPLTSPQDQRGLAPATEAPGGLPSDQPPVLLPPPIGGGGNFSGLVPISATTTSPPPTGASNESEPATPPRRVHFSH